MEIAIHFMGIFVYTIRWVILVFDLNLYLNPFPHIYTRYGRRRAWYIIT